MADKIEWLKPAQDLGEEPAGESLGLTGGSGNGEASDRLMRLETAIAEIRGEIRGLRQAQNTNLAAIGLVLAVVAAFGVYTLQRVDQIPSELRGIADSITGAITATRDIEQRPPIIINVPPLAPDTSAASPSRPESHQQSDPHQLPSDGSNETPAPEGSAPDG